MIFKRAIPGMIVLRLLMAVALLFAPMQFANTVQASAPVSMSDMPCQEPQPCCDLDMSDCDKMRGCMAIGGIVAALGTASATLAFAYPGAREQDFTTIVPSPHETAPLRRPPRI